MSANGLRYDMADRNSATCYGGIGLAQAMARQSGLVDAINEHVELLQSHFPYHESDHVLNIAYNAMTDGTCLEDLKKKRADEAYLNALGAKRIPDSSTAGDFCRRFESKADIDTLHQAIDAARRNVWAQQPDEFFDRATVYMDGSIVETTGECKFGMDMSYKGVWGYHPLLISLAETREPLRIVNRSGNQTSEDGAAAECDDVAGYLRECGFREIVFQCHDRCEQENLIEQLKNGPRSLNAPVDNLYSNWAYMLISSLAWTLKAWLALSLPETGRWKEQRRKEKCRLLKMEFRTFVTAITRIPCQIVRTGRQRIFRLLNGNDLQPAFWRLVDVLRL